MKRIKIKGIEEEIFYHKLDNGLDVYLYTKEGFHNNYVTFTTKFGSIYFCNGILKALRRSF